MTDAEQKIEEAIALAVEALSERLSRELSVAFNSSDWTGAAAAIGNH
jgi:hypothetical protein